MRERKKAKQPSGMKSKAQRPNLVHELFAKHLRELGLQFEREHPVVYNRKWRWDFVTWVNGKRYGIEIDGYFQGRHGAGWGADNDKQNMGVVFGYYPLRFSTNDVKRGKAKEFIAQHLLGQKA